MVFAKFTAYFFLSLSVFSFIDGEYISFIICTGVFAIIQSAVFIADDSE